MSASLDITGSFKNYLQHERRFSEHTITAYTRDINQFQTFLDETIGQETDFLEVTYRQVRQWVVALMTKGLKAKSVNRKLSSLRTFYHFLKKQGRISVNPTARVVGPKSGKRLPQYLKEDEMQRLLEELQFPEGFQGLRDRLILAILYECGLRRSELIGLDTSNVNLSRGLIKVMGKGSKERVLPISRGLCELIKEYLDFRGQEFPSDHDALLVSDKGERLYPKLVYNKVVRYLSSVTSLEKRSPHILRHTFATHLTGRGAEIKAVKDLLGHASLAATQIYTHNDIEKLKKAYKGAHPRS